MYIKQWLCIEYKIYLAVLYKVIHDSKYNHTIYNQSKANPTHRTYSTKHRENEILSERALEAIMASIIWTGSFYSPRVVLFNKTISYY